MESKNVNGAVEYMKNVDSQNNYIDDNDINIWELRKPVNARIKTEETWATALVKAAADLVFYDIPSPSEPTYQTQLRRFEEDLYTALRCIKPKEVKGFRVISHTPTKEPERGSLSGDLFVLEMDYDNGVVPETYTVKLRLTSTSQELVTKIIEERNAEEHETAFDKLAKTYFELEHTFAEDIKADIKIDRDIILTKIVEEINSLYKSHPLGDGYAKMNTPEFYREQAEILLAKMQIMPKDTHPNTIRNYNALLKYFICKYLKKNALNKYNDVD